MKKSILTPLLFLMSIGLFGQEGTQLFVDSNPLLTNDEAAWLNANFATDSFDFTNKTIGILEVMPAFYGMGKFTFPMLKKRLPNMILDKIAYKVVVLDTIDKVKTKGYDAVLLIAGKSHKGKLRKLTHETIITNAINYYPQIPTDAGKDSDPLLSNANAAFFTELYKMCRPYDTLYDFSGKKVAVCYSVDIHDGIRQISIAEYVHNVRTELNESGTWWLGSLNFLTEEQKKTAGGYDVIIVHDGKKGKSLSAFINMLKAENNP